MVFFWFAQTNSEANRPATAASFPQIPVEVAVQHDCFGKQFRWWRGSFRALAEGAFDKEDVVRRAIELADFVQAAAVRYGFDGKRLIAVGYSNGANIAAAILLLRPEVLGGAILFRAMEPLQPSVLPKL